MIYSMTACAYKKIKGNWGTATWEIRSVNQRYLEIRFRIPEEFHNLEPSLRQRFRRNLARGKIECSLHFEVDPALKEKFTINELLAKQVINTANQVMKLSGKKVRLDPFQVLNWPGVIEIPKRNMDDMNQELLNTFDDLLNEFIQTRAQEGNNIEVLIKQRLIAITEQLFKIRTCMPKILEWQRKRLLNKFQEVEIELESTRAEQELLLLAQKSDVSEELDRLDFHVEETNNIIKKGGVVGRRLDFMMQEFNRESNTLASKSISTDVTSSSITLKVLIEQIREQIQNIE
ncbi:hypothetical protein CF67_25029 [Candidatus Photodesmus blepharus]|uniref:YicC family protein n=1 Tax=Candidatus Photodesmus blepharonis TaxID=1179155 RepID=A0A084CNC7_9GAMM|nr:YicC/YloC family endoribonuclease [Candidatus Photodesmus blepharus]KEY91306.1 hypothetical protein CF67_25029 [Candidatus Photodesmus blepharus]